MPPLLKLLLVVAVLLVVPTLVLVAWSEPMQAAVVRWESDPPHPAWLGGLVVALLSCDLFLPVPSAPIMTLAGAQLGFWWGIVVSWIGLTAGSTIGYGVARVLGEGVAKRVIAHDNLHRMTRQFHRHSFWLLATTRPLPILAESWAVVAGLLNTPWPRFLQPVALGNLVMAVAFVGLGQWAAKNELLVVAVCISAALPLSLLWHLRRRQQRQ